MLTSNGSARIRPTAPCNTCRPGITSRSDRQLPKAAYPTNQRGWTRPPARAPPSRCLRSSTRAASRGRPLITRKWSSGYQIIEQRAYAYAALTEDRERAVDEAGGAKVKLRDAPVSHSVICLGLHGHARSRRYARSRCDTDHDAVRPRMGNSAPKSVVRQSLSFCCWHVHGFSYVATVSSLGPLSGDRLVRRPADSSPGWRRARMAVFRARGSWRLDLRVAGRFGQQILTTIAARPAPTQLPAGHAPRPVRPCGRSWESPPAGRLSALVRDAGGR